LWLLSVGIFQDIQAELNLLKFIHSNANSKTDVGQYLETLQEEKHPSGVVHQDRCTDEHGS
jgi:hypothetical protein